MENGNYTTGEIAKICNVSRRTVQYYDREGIIQPSKISEGGRRIYSNEDLQKFKLVILYKNLGLSLKEIKDVLCSENKYKVITDILTQQNCKLEQQIHEMIDLKKKITILLDDLNLNREVTVLNCDELNDLIHHKEHHEKVGRLTYLLLSLYMIIIVMSGYLISILGGLFSYIIIGIDIAFLLFLIYFHSSQNAYVCPYCKYKFTINFFQDMFSFNNGKKGKYLKCPNCHKRSWISETYKEN